MKRLQTKTSEKLTFVSSQGKQNVECRKEEHQTDKENFNRYLQTESQITPV